MTRITVVWLPSSVKCFPQPDSCFIHCLTPHSDYSSLWITLWRQLRLPPPEAAPQWVTRSWGGECLGSDQRLANEVIQLTEGNGHRCQMQMTTKALERVVAITCVSTTSLPSNNGYIEMPLSHMAWPYNLCGFPEDRHQTYDLCVGGHICLPFKLLN